jgi:multiple sugar transport system permease protein
MGNFTDLLNQFGVIVFIAPWLVGLFVLTVGPMSQSFYLSLTEYNLLELPTWVGFANYQEIFTDDKSFWKSL